MATAFDQLSQPPRKRSPGFDMNAWAQQQEQERQGQDARAQQEMSRVRAEAEASAPPAPISLGQMHSAGGRSATEMLASGLDSGARSFFDAFQKKPETPAAPVAPNPTDQRLADGTQTSPLAAPFTAQPAVSSPQPPAAVPGPGEVTKVGNSYSGTNVSGDVSINGQLPRNGGQVSSQNMTAADALAGRQASESLARVQSAAAGSQSAGVQAPVVQHSGNSWQARNDLRNLQVSASSIMNNGGPWDKHKGVSPERAAYEAAVATDQTLKGAQPSMDQEAMRQNAGLQRESIHQQGANARAMLSGGIDAGRLAIEQERQGIASRYASQIDAQRRIAIDPSATPEQRSAAARALMTLQGQAPAPRWKTSVVPGGVDAAGQKLPGYGLLTDESTGEHRVIQPGQGGGTPSTAAVAALRADPKRAAEFDAKFGAGAARAALGS